MFSSHPNFAAEPSGRPPRISVLVPTFNYARFLPAAIESVLAQNRGDFELLISDDASTDGSAEVVRNWAARDPRIRFALQPRNLGMVANWNACLAHARGDFVRFLFGDDLLPSPDSLGRMAALLESDDRVSLAASARLLLDERSRATGVWDDLPTGRHAGAAVVARCLQRRANLIGEPSSVMFRRELARRGFDLRFRQIVDLELWFHLLLQGDLAYTSERLGAFRRHERQQTVRNHRDRVPQLELIELLDRYLRQPALAPYIPPGGFAHHLLIYRQLHYARKAARDRPDARAGIARHEGRLPWRWRMVCGAWHRLSRPLQNLRRSATRRVDAWRPEIRAGIGRPLFPRTALSPDAP